MSRYIFWYGSRQLSDGSVAQELYIYDADRYFTSNLYDNSNGTRALVWCGRSGKSLTQSTYTGSQKWDLMFEEGTGNGTAITTHGTDSTTRSVPATIVFPNAASSYAPDGMVCFKYGDASYVTKLGSAGLSGYQTSTTKIGNKTYFICVPSWYGVNTQTLPSKPTNGFEKYAYSVRLIIDGNASDCFFLNTGSIYEASLEVDAGFSDNPSLRSWKIGGDITTAHIGSTYTFSDDVACCVQVSVSLYPGGIDVVSSPVFIHPMYRFAVSTSTISSGGIAQLIIATDGNYGEYPNPLENVTNLGWYNNDSYSLYLDGISSVEYCAWYSETKSGESVTKTLFATNWTEQSSLISDFETDSNSGITSIADGKYLFVLRLSNFATDYNGGKAFLRTVVGDFIRCCVILEVSNGSVVLTPCYPSANASSTKSRNIYLNSSAAKNRLGLLYDYYLETDFVAGNPVILGSSEVVVTGSSPALSYTYDRAVSSQTLNKTQLSIPTPVISKTYDGTAFNLSDTSTFPSSMIVDGVTVGISYALKEGVTLSKNVGGYVIKPTYTLSQSDQENYEIDPASQNQEFTATITKKSIVLENVSADDREYDGGTEAEIFWESVDAIYNNEVEVRATGTFVDKNVGDNKAVSVTFSVEDKVSGSGASSNYNAPTATTLTASITPAALFVTLPEVVFDGKPYDGTALSQATVNGISLPDNTTKTITGFSGFSGFIGSEGASLKARAVYDPSLAATQGPYQVIVTFSLTANSGTSLDNYEISYSAQNPTSKTATISAPLQAPVILSFDVTSDGTVELRDKTAYLYESDGEEYFRVVCYSPSSTSDNKPKIRWDDGTAVTMNAISNSPGYYRRTVFGPPRKNGNYSLAHKCEIYINDGDNELSSCCYFVNLLDNGLASSPSPYYSGSYDGSFHERLPSSLSNIYFEGTTPGTLTFSNGVFEQDNDGYWLSSLGTTIKNSGSYGVSEERNGTITRNGISYDARVYAIGAVYSIAPKVLNPTVSVTKVYDGTNAINSSHISCVVPSGSIASGDNVAVVASVPNGLSGIDVGSYSNTTVHFELTNNNLNNYTISDKTVTASITKKQLTIDPNNPTTIANKVYDKTNSATPIVGAVLGIYNNEISVTASGSFDSVNAGNRVVNVVYGLSGVKTSNYIAPPGQQIAAPIAQRELRIDITSFNIDKEYDGSQYNNNPVFGFVNGYDILSADTGVVSVSCVADFESPIAQPHAAAPLTFSLTDPLGNYYLASPPVYTYGIINQRKLTISGTTVDDKPGDGSVTSNRVNVGTLSRVVPGDDVSVIGTATFPSSAIGTYTTVVVSYDVQGDSATNYLPPDDTTGLTASIYSTTHITQFAIDSSSSTYTSPIVGSSGSREYKGSQYYIRAYVDNERATDSKYTFTWTRTGTSTVYSTQQIYVTNVGEYKVNCTLVNKTTQEVIEFDEFTFTIDKRRLAFVQGEETTVANKVYDGGIVAEITPGTLDTSLIIGSQKVSIASCSGNFPSPNVGTHAVGVSYTLSGANRNNYILPDEMINATISPKQLTVTGTVVVNKEYDKNTNADIHVGTVSGRIGQEDVNVTASGSFAGADAGTYNVDVTYGLSGLAIANYTPPSTETIQATITPKELTVGGAFVQDKEYNGNTTRTINRSGAYVTGFISPDSGSVSNVTSSPTAFSSLHTNTTEFTLTYIVTFLSGDPNNYTYNNQKTVSAEIYPKPVSISSPSFSLSSKPYDGNALNVVLPSPTISGLVSRDSGKITVSASPTYTPSLSKDCGPYRVDVSFDVVSSNPSTYRVTDYEFTVPASVSASGTISKKSLRINKGAVADKYYDGNPLALPAPSVYSEDFIAGEGATIAVDGLRTVFPDSVDAGIYDYEVWYTLTPNSGTSLSNYIYDISPLEDSATISPRPITISGISSVKD